MRRPTNGRLEPQGNENLQGRGLTQPVIIAHLRIGFANRTLGYRLPEKNRESGAEIRDRPQTLGFARPRSPTDL